MKCPVCGAAELVRDTRDMPYTYKGESTVIPALTGDYCPACAEVVLDMQEAERFDQQIRDFNKQVNAAIVDPQFIAGVDAIEAYIDSALPTSSTAKKATNVSLAEGLLAEAKALHINVSQAAEAGVAKAVAEKRAELWLQENREAIESSNAYVEKHGLPLEKFKMF